MEKKRSKFNIYEVYDGDLLIFTGRYGEIVKKFKISYKTSMYNYISSGLKLDGKYTVKLKNTKTAQKVDWMAMLYNRLMFARENYGVTNSISNKKPDLEYLKERGMVCTARKVRDDGGNRDYYYVVECEQ